MSRESLAVVEALWATFLRGGFTDSTLSPDLEWYPRADEPDTDPDGEPILGPERVREMLVSWWGTVEQSWLGVDEFLDYDDQVIVCWRGGGIGRQSRIPIEWEETHVCTVRDGTVIRVREYRTRAEALEAAGTSTT